MYLPYFRKSGMINKIFYGGLYVCLKTAAGGTAAKQYFQYIHKPYKNQIISFFALILFCENWNF